MSKLQKIDPATMQKWLSEGNVLIVDVREPDEHRREWIEGATNLPLSDLSQTNGLEADGKTIVFHCKSGMRTIAHAPTLSELARQCGATAGYVLEGGLEGWKAAGHKVHTDRAQPLELQRQVQITAGTLVVTGLLLGLMVHPGFLGLSGFVGAGLVFAGVSGTCGMAKLLALMPWNKTKLA